MSMTMIKGMKIRMSMVVLILTATASVAPFVEAETVITRHSSRPHLLHLPHLRHNHYGCRRRRQPHLDHPRPLRLHHDHLQPDRRLPTVSPCHRCCRPLTAFRGGKGARDPEDKVFVACVGDYDYNGQQ